MIRYEIYKLIHYFGIIVVVIAIAITCFHVLSGGTRADNPARKSIGIWHGLAMVFILVGGFGMLARLGIVQSGLPGWVIAKLIVWLLLGMAIVLPYRKPALARPVLWALPFLAVLAAFLALYKPF
ncbi:MAG: hypothetical protein ACRENP_22015 [Longimicrobiales bacterium]